MEARNQNMKLKIWEKNWPTREGKIKELCDKAIPQSTVQIHPQMQKMIN